MRKTVLFSSSLVAILLAVSHAQAASAPTPTANRKPAQNGPVAFSCSAKEGKSGFDLVISSNGDARAELNQDGKSYSCPLKISKFADKRKSKVPSVSVTLNRAEACSPALPSALNRSLKGKFALNLVKSGRKPASNVSFMMKKDDATCTPTNFKVADFNTLIRKWNKK